MRRMFRLFSYAAAIALPVTVGASSERDPWRIT